MSFSTDFLGPTTFYSLLSSRYKVNPIFLPRNGNILIGSATTKLFGLTFEDIRVNHVETLVVKKGDKLRQVDFQIPLASHKSINSPSQSKDDYELFTWTQVVVIALVADTPTASGNSQKSTVAESSKIVESVLLKFQNQRDVEDSIANSNVQYCVFEVVYPFQIASSFPSDSQNTVGTETYRSHFLPIFCDSRQTVVLSSKIQSKFLAHPYLNSPCAKSDVSIDIEFSWSNTSASQECTLVQYSNSSLQPPEIFYHYLFNQKSETTESEEWKSVVERCVSIVCPWCTSDGNPHAKKLKTQLGKTGNKLADGWDEVSIAEVLRLLIHLESFHFHFTFEAVVDKLWNLHIIVRRDRSQDSDGMNIYDERIRPYVYWRQFSTLLTTAKNIYIPQLKFSGNEDKSKKNTTGASKQSKADQLIEKLADHPRQYYHARLGIPLTDFEFLNYDSDDDIDMTWDQNAANRGLEEFEDICMEEKLFFQLWNVHINSFPPYSSAYIPFVCELFIKKFGFMIHAKRLRHNFLLHLLTLVDFNLLRMSDVCKSMASLDAVAYDPASISSIVSDETAVSASTPNSGAANNTTAHVTTHSLKLESQLEAGSRTAPARKRLKSSM